MISTSCFALNWKTLPLVLVIFTIFTVSLSDNLQVADGFSASGTKLIFETNPGETVTQTWAVVNDETEVFDVEFYAEGKGSEFFVFEKFMTLEPATRKAVDIFVIIPADHPDNIEYHPVLYALKRPIASADDLHEGASIKVLLQMKTNPIIKIGDNPVFTPEPVTNVNIIPDETEKPKQQVEEPIVQEETMQEKLARIQANNIANQLAEVKVDDTWQETFEEEAVPELQVDDDYVPEPKGASGNWTFTPTYDEVQECDFFALILSWFGFGKC